MSLPSPKQKSLSKFLFVSVLPPLLPKVPNQQTSCQQNDPERLDSLSRSQIANAAYPPELRGKYFPINFPPTANPTSYWCYIALELSLHPVVHTSKHPDAYVASPHFTSSHPNSGVGFVKETNFKHTRSTVSFSCSVFQKNVTRTRKRKREEMIFLQLSYLANLPCRPAQLDFNFQLEVFC